VHLDFGVRHARVVPSVQKNAQEMVFVTMENVNVTLVSRVKIVQHQLNVLEWYQIQTVITRPSPVVETDDAFVIVAIVHLVFLVTIAQRLRRAKMVAVRTVIVKMEYVFVMLVGVDKIVLVSFLASHQIVQDVVCACSAHVHVTKDGQAVVVLLKCRVQTIVQIVGSALMGDVSVILATMAMIVELVDI
jgi:hypothetical protein